MSFYIFFALGIAKVVFGYFPIKTKNYVKRRLENKRGFKQDQSKVQIRNVVVICLIIGLSLLTFLLFGLNLTFYTKNAFIKSGKKLSSMHTKSKNTINEVSVSKKITIFLYLENFRGD